MNISEEKLMDYADGLLSEEEEAEVLSIIKDEPALMKTVEDLKSGLVLAKAGYDYAVENAPDPTTRSNRKNESLVYKISNLFTLPKKYLAPIAACFVLVIGGTQYYKLTSTTQFASMEAEKLFLRDELEIIKEYQEFASLEVPGSTQVRGPEDNIINNSKWWVKDIITINVSNINSKNPIDVPINGKLYIGDTIQISLQVLDSTKIEMSLVSKGTGEIIELFNGNLEPGLIKNKYEIDAKIYDEFDIAPPAEEQEIIIKYNYKGENKTANFVFEVLDE